MNDFDAVFNVRFRFNDEEEKAPVLVEAPIEEPSLPAAPECHPATPYVLGGAVALALFGFLALVVLAGTKR